MCTLAKWSMDLKKRKMGNPRNTYTRFRELKNTDFWIIAKEQCRNQVIQLRKSVSFENLFKKKMHTLRPMIQGGSWMVWREGKCILNQKVLLKSTLRPHNSTSLHYFFAIWHFLLLCFWRTHKKFWFGHNRKHQLIEKKNQFYFLLKKSMDMGLNPGSDF